MQQLLQKYPILKKWEPIYKNCKDFYEKNTKNCLTWGVIFLVIISFYVGKETQMSEIVTGFQNTQDGLLGWHMDSKSMKNALKWWNLQQNGWTWIPVKH